MLNMPLPSLSTTFIPVGVGVYAAHHTCKEEMVSSCIAIYNVKSVIYAKKMAPLL